MNFKFWFISIFICSAVTVTCQKKSGTVPQPPPPPSGNADTSFTNPLLSSGPDPWVTQKDTNYYYTNTFGNRLALYKTSKMSQLNNAPLTTIWTPPVTGPYSKDIWAPELHYVQGKWYMYFAADDGTNATHRIYVLENTAADPTTGTWDLKGKVADPADKWAIDASEFDYNGQSYLIWSGWPGDVDGQQNIYIALLSNPWTISGNRVLLSTPDYAWEKNGAPPVVNEGPEVISNATGKIFLTYSASGCWTDDYAMGMLSLKAGGDPLNPADWTKSSTPVFTKKPENGAYGPGHNGFFKSRDGTEDWIIYHANSSSGQGCGNARNPRMQKFTWNADGSPNFGVPVPINIPIRKPRGE
ncbi:MAG: family 43 glycosylhydrolase [Flavisolibacter sp.]